MNRETETTKETNTFIFKIKKIEDVTVPAGTFSAFKVVEFDQEGNAVGTSWESAVVKHFNVRWIDNRTNVWQNSSHTRQ